MKIELRAQRHEPKRAQSSYDKKRPDPEIRIQKIQNSLKASILGKEACGFTRWKRKESQEGFWKIRNSIEVQFHVLVKNFGTALAKKPWNESQTRCYEPPKKR